MFSFNIDLFKTVINGVVVGGLQIGVDSYMAGGMSMNKYKMKEFGVDFAVMGSATIVNELLVNSLSLPSFLQTLKNTYGVDILTVVLYVVVKNFLPGEYKGSLVRNVLLGLGTVLITNYVETPLRPYAPNWLLPKV